MDFEAVVMQYLAAKGLFLSPQFSILDGGREWSCPDFVALDFRQREIQVIEVSAAYAIHSLVEKLRNCEEQWFKRLRPQLVALGSLTSPGSALLMHMSVRIGMIP